MNPASDLFLSVRQDESVDQDTARCVVRLTTNCFISGGRITFSKVLSRLKRKSELTFDEISRRLEQRPGFWSHHQPDVM